MAKHMKLSPAEKKLIAAVRALARSEHRLASIAPRLKEHGDVSITEAARLLSRPLAEVRAMLGTALPRSEDGRVPLSELRRHVEARCARELRVLHAWVGNLYRPPGAALSLFLGEQWGRRTLEQAAGELGITARAVRDLVDAGKLFAVRIGRGALSVSREEIEAYRAAREKAYGAMTSKLGRRSVVDLALFTSTTSGPVIRSRRRHAA